MENLRFAKYGSNGTEMVASGASSVSGAFGAFGALGESCEFGESRAILSRLALLASALLLSAVLLVPQTALAQDDPQPLYPVNPADITVDVAKPGLPYYDMRTGEWHDDGQSDESPRISASPQVILTEKEEECYDALAAGYRAGLTTISLVDSNGSHSFTRDQLKHAIEETRNRGEFFYVSNVSYSYSLATGNVTSLFPTYTITPGEELDEARATFEAKVSRVVNAIPSDMDDYLKVQYVHDYLVHNCEYDLRVYSQPVYSGDPIFSSYGALVNGWAVCDGYTHAAMVLFNRLGIDASYVGSDEMCHAWNLVRIDGRWYQMDITWDDPVYSGASGPYNFPDKPISYKYYLKSDSSFLNKLGHYDWAADYVAQSDYPLYTYPDLLSTSFCDTYGHQWVDGDFVTPVTCIQDGEREQVCGGCGLTRQVTVTAPGHNIGLCPAREATCESGGCVEHYACERCGQAYEDAEGTVPLDREDVEIAALGHERGEWVTIKEPTYVVSGAKSSKCVACGKALETKSIPAKDKTVLTSGMIKLSTVEYAYSGSIKKPSVSVYLDGEKLSSKDYAVTYASGRKYVGTYKVTVKAASGNHPIKGTAYAYFKILPKSTYFTGYSRGTTYIIPKWHKRTSQTSGYRVQCATSPDFAEDSLVKSYTVSGCKSRSKKFSSLQRGTTYYFRVCAYKTRGGTKYYSAWSKTKAISTKGQPVAAEDSQEELDQTQEELGQTQG